MAKIVLAPGFYAAFYKGTRPGLPGLFNILVRWWDKGPYSHCEMIFSNGQSASSSLLDGGVRFKDIEYDTERWDLFALPAHLENRASNWFVCNAGSPYNWIGNVAHVLDFLNVEVDAFNCSEAFGCALGIVEPFRFTPNGLAALCRTWVPAAEFSPA